MDFFEHQDAARQGSRRLIWLFVLAVAVITLVVAGLAGGSVLLIAAQEGAQRGTGLTAASVGRLPLWETVGIAAVITLGLIGLGSWYKTAQLAGGGAAVARSVGATAIDTDTTDPHARRLLNVVEEIAIAAGCPVPAVYLMENEEGINAFAAGWSLDDAVIGVTHGTMHRLTRDELQGVVAHEFSHILHGDMRLNLRLTGLVFGILALSVVGALVMRMVGEGASRGRYHRRDRRSDDGGAVAVVVAIFVAGAVLYAVGSLGVFFARLIQAAVSRQREFLADASAVQYTRNPDGIGNALLKIGGLAQGSRLRTAHASEFQHLFFGSSGGGVLNAALATHPPLTDRIARLLPAWDGRWRDAEPRRARPEHDRPRPTMSPAMAGFAGHPVEAEAGPTASAARPALGFIGEPTPAHLQRARELIDGLPALLARAARTPAGAPAVVFALLSKRTDGAAAGAQRSYLHDHAGPTVADLTDRLADAVVRLDPASRLPLLDLTLPALKALHPRDRRAFEAHVDQLIGADGRLGLFEWALRQALWRHLMGPAAAERTRRTARLADHHDDLSTLLAVLAGVDGTVGTVGTVEVGRANRSHAAFAAGAAVVDGLPTVPPPSTQRGNARLTDAVDRLGTLVPADTRKVVHACAAAVSADGRVTVREFELLRAVAETLDVPVPPLLPGQRLV